MEQFEKARTRYKRSEHYQSFAKVLWSFEDPKGQFMLECRTCYRLGRVIVQFWTDGQYLEYGHLRSVLDDFTGSPQVNYYGEKKI